MTLALFLKTYPLHGFSLKQFEQKKVKIAAGIDLRRLSQNRLHICMDAVRVRTGHIFLKISMGIEIRPDYDRIFLLLPGPEESVGEDHPVGFIRDFADLLDLEEPGFRIPEAIEGRPPYADDLLLKVWLYGYINKVLSKKIIKVKRSLYQGVDKI